MIWFCFVQNRFLLLLVLWAILVPSQPFCAQQSNSAPAQARNEQELRRTVSRALNSLGIFYYEKHGSAKAIETLEKALNYDPENRNIRTNLAMMYLERQQFEKVLEQLGSAARLNEHDQRMLTALAVSNFALGKYDQAALFYKKLVQLLPEDLVLRLTLAVAYYLSGQQGESENTLKQLPGDQTTQAQFKVILGDAYRFRSKAAEALAEYEKAISLAPGLREVNYRLGVLQSELHNYEKAAEAFRRELSINPDNDKANYSLGAYCLSYGNDPHQARKYFEKTLQLNPQHLGAYLGLMKIHLNQSQPAEVLQLANKAEELARENEEFHYLKSRALNLLGKKDLAEKELKIFEEMTAKKW
jgi:tetratricopeptide (TPR) repeat protein